MGDHIYTNGSTICTAVGMCGLCESASAADMNDRFRFVFSVSKRDRLCIYLGKSPCMVRLPCQYLIKLKPPMMVYNNLNLITYLYTLNLTVFKLQFNYK